MLISPIKLHHHKHTPSADLREGTYEADPAYQAFLQARDAAAMEYMEIKEKRLQAAQTVTTAVASSLAASPADIPQAQLMTDIAQHKPQHMTSEAAKLLKSLGLKVPAPPKAASAKHGKKPPKKAKQPKPAGSKPPKKGKPSSSKATSEKPGPAAPASGPAPAPAPAPTRKTRAGKSAAAAAAHAESSSAGAATAGNRKPRPGKPKKSTKPPKARKTKAAAAPAAADAAK